MGKLRGYFHPFLYPSSLYAQPWCPIIRVYPILHPTCCPHIQFTFTSTSQIFNPLSLSSFSFFSFSRPRPNRLYPLLQTSLLALSYELQTSRSDKWIGQQPSLCFNYSFSFSSGPGHLLPPLAFPFPILHTLFTLFNNSPPGPWNSLLGCWQRRYWSIWLLPSHCNAALMGVILHWGGHSTLVHNDPGVNVH